MASRVLAKSLRLYFRFSFLGIIVGSYITIVSTSYASTNNLSRDEAKRILSLRKLITEVDWYSNVSNYEQYKRDSVIIPMSETSKEMPLSYFSCLENKNFVKKSKVSLMSTEVMRWGRYPENGGGILFTLTELGRKYLNEDLKIKFNIIVNKITGIQLMQMESNFAKVFFEGMAKGDKDNPFSQCFENYWNIQLHDAYAILALFDDGWRFQEWNTEKELTSSKIVNSEEPRKKLTLSDCEKAKEYYNQANSIKGDIEKEISLYKKAIELCPDFAKAHESLGIIYYSEKGTYDDAIRECKEALRIDPKLVNNHNILGNIYKRNGSFDDAIREYKKALRIDPNYDLAHMNLGYSYKEQSRYDDAISEFKEVLRIKPNVADAQRALEECEKHNEAKKQQILSLQTDGSNAIKNQNWNAAIQIYKKLLDINLENYNANLDIGIAYAMLNEFDLSIKHLTKANLLNPTAYWPYYIMSVTYARKGDTDHAIECLQKAIDKGVQNIIDLKSDAYLPQDFKRDPKFKKLINPTLAKLTAGIKDASLFETYSQELPYKYDDVWEVVGYVLKDQKEKVVQSDKETGVVLTDTCRWSMNRKFYKYYISIEQPNEISTRLNLKLCAYDSCWQKELQMSVLEPMNKAYVNKIVIKFLEGVKKRLEEK